MKTPLHLLMAMAVGLPLMSQDRLYVFAADPAAWGASSGIDFGRRFAGLGDINGDGFADFVYGAIYIAYGTPLSLWRKTGFYVISGKDGRVIRKHIASGAKPGHALHWAGECAALLDIDGDGIRDYALGSPSEHVGSLLYAGRVYLFSGKTGKLLLRIDGTKSMEGFGTGLMGAAPDLDGDGIPDFWIRSHAGGTIKTRVRSSRTGKILREHIGEISDPIGDVDGDKVSDYVRGYADSTKGKYAGAVDLISGKSGKVIRTWYGNGPWEGFGSGLAAAGDVNGDGRPDFIATAGHYYMNPVFGSGYVKVISSAGPTLWEWRGIGSVWDNFGRSAGSVGDVDKDGRPDIYISSLPRDPKNPRLPVKSQVSVYSGKTGKRLWTAFSGMKGDRFGEWTKPVGDVNGDGFADLAIGGGVGTTSAKTFQTLHIVGGGLRSFRSDKSSLSLPQTESANLSLTAGPLHSGKLFLILGGLSGNGPGMGLQYDVFKLPLAWDAYTSMTLAHPMGMLYTRGMGFLGAGGKAQSRFFLPSWLPRSLIGTTFTHSFVVFDLKKSRVDFISAAVETKVTL